MCAVGAGEEKCEFSVAIISAAEGKLTQQAQVYEHIGEKDFYRLHALRIISEIEAEIDNHTLHELKTEKRTGMLIWVLPGRLSEREKRKERIDELVNLAGTADLAVVGRLVQHKDKPDGVFCLGRGKLEELAMLMQNTHADCVIFENTLSPAQENNLNRALGKKVLDKNGLILDIFAARAKSREGQLRRRSGAAQLSLAALDRAGRKHVQIRRRRRHARTW